MNSIFHHLLCFYSFFVLSTSTHSAIVNRTTIISSPRITDWGAWGPWSTCPNREYVYGFQLKTERNRGEFDDTGLNGIRLFCAKSGQVRNFSHVVESSSGAQGIWGVRYACPGTQFATAFELLSEPGQGGGPGPLGGDDTAANNLQLVCNRGVAESTLTGDGTRWGIWSGRQVCSVNFLICGIRTQVETPMYEGVDDSGLNNVDMKCCSSSEKV